MVRIKAAWMALVAASLSLIWCDQSLGQAPMREDPERLLSFGHHLLSRGQPYRAEGEYLAFLSLFPNHPLAGEAWFYLGVARREQKLWEEALEAFRKARELARGSLSHEAAMEMGKTLILAGEHKRAAIFLEKLASETEDSPQGKMALIMASEAWIMAREYERAIALLSLVRPGDPGFHEAWDLRQRIERGLRNLPRRDPTVAGLLSALLPGMGHLYAGRPLEALTSLALNGTFLAGIVYSAKEGCFVSAGILSFLELSWYLGGVESAMDSAKRFNEEAQERWLRELGLPSSVGPDKGGGPTLSFGLKWRF